MSTKKASHKFVADFNLVSRRYMLAELGEIEEAKQCARDDMRNAEVSYATMAKEISSCSN